MQKNLPAIRPSHAVPTGFPSELRDSIPDLKKTKRRIIKSTCGSQALAKDVYTILSLHADQNRHQERWQSGRLRRS